MKKKLRIALVTIAILIIGFILMGPMAPVWEKLGLEPYCIQGNFPHLKITACPNQAAQPVGPILLPTPGADGLVPIIVDDDGSPDGTIALLYFLCNPLFDVRAVTISYGEAHPEVFARHITQILSAFGRTDIPVGYGSDAPIEGTNAFPESWRQASDAFWNIPLPEYANAEEPVPAVELIIKVVTNSDQPLMIFVSGAHTNLAEALRIDPSIASNIRAVTIMGGAVNVPGNIHSDWPDFDNKVSEWNIWVDPLAASEVFSSGLDLHLVPLDATQQVTWEKADLRGWRKSDAPESNLAADLAQMMLDAWGVDSVYLWDLVAAAQAAIPKACPEILVGLKIDTTPGPEQGQTISISQQNNVSVCLDPDPAQIKSVVDAVFQQP